MKAKTDFTSIIKQFEYHYDLRTVFGDFLSMTLCAVAPNPLTGVSHYEDEYLKVIEKYKLSPLRKEFPKLLGQLIFEMEERHDSSLGNDILGEFYEQYIYRKGAAQFFTPPPICEFMARCQGEKSENEKPLNILDPACGSGRMLLAASRTLGKDNHFYGIDIDQQCAQMTALNLFFNGLFKSEVIWGDALNASNFNISYKISFLPFGVFRIYEKENSLLWQMQHNSIVRDVKTTSSSIEFNEKISQFLNSNNSQLQLF